MATSKRNRFEVDEPEIRQKRRRTTAWHDFDRLCPAVGTLCRSHPHETLATPHVHPDTTFKLFSYTQVVLPPEIVLLVVTYACGLDHMDRNKVVKSATAAQAASTLDAVRGTCKQWYNASVMLYTNDEGEVDVEKWRKLYFYFRFGLVVPHWRKMNQSLLDVGAQRNYGPFRIKVYEDKERTVQLSMSGITLFITSEQIKLTLTARPTTLKLFCYTVWPKEEIECIFKHDSGLRERHVFTKKEYKAPLFEFYRVLCEAHPDQFGHKYLHSNAGEPPMLQRFVSYMSRAFPLLFHADVRFSWDDRTATRKKTCSLMDFAQIRGNPKDVILIE